MSQVAEANKLLSDAQFGFRSSKSTIDAVFVMMTLMRKAKLSGKEFSVGFVDISKVYRVF